MVLWLNLYLFKQNENTLGNLLLFPSKLVIKKPINEEFDMFYTYIFILSKNIDLFTYQHYLLT